MFVPFPQKSANRKLQRRVALLLGVIGSQLARRTQLLSDLGHILTQRTLPLRLKTITVRARPRRPRQLPRNHRLQILQIPRLRLKISRPSVNLFRYLTDVIRHANPSHSTPTNSASSSQTKNWQPRPPYRQPQPPRNGHHYPYLPLAKRKLHSSGLPALNQPASTGRQIAALSTRIAGAEQDVALLGIRLQREPTRSAIDLHQQRAPPQQRAALRLGDGQVVDALRRLVQGDSVGFYR